MENIPMEVRSKRRLELYEKTEKVEKLTRQNKINILQEKCNVKEAFLQYVAKDIACNEREIEMKGKQHVEWNSVIDWYKDNPVEETENPVREIKRNIKKVQAEIQLAQTKLEKLRSTKTETEVRLKHLQKQLTTFAKRRKHMNLTSESQHATESELVRSPEIAQKRHQKEHFIQNQEQKPELYELPSDPRRRRQEKTQNTMDNPNTVLKQAVPATQQKSAVPPEEDEVVIVGEVWNARTSSPSLPFAKTSLYPEKLLEILRKKLGSETEKAQCKSNKRAKFDEAQCTSDTSDTNVCVFSQLQHTSCPGYPDQVSQISSSESPPPTVVLEIINGNSSSAAPETVLGTVEKSIHFCEHMAS